MRNLTLRGLRVFEAAATTGSYSRGAELMGLTQSAVSQQIRQLEDEVGTRLFDTHARPIRLTDAGTELLRHARVILAQVSVAEDALSTLDSQFRGQLHVAVVSPGHYFMPALLAGFRRLYPDLRIKLTLGRRDDLLTRLADRQIDLLFGGYPSAESDVEAEAFARHPHVLIAPPNHALARRRGLQWADLAAEAFIFREPGSATRSFLEHLQQVQRLQVRADIEMHGPEAVKAAVMAGMGISFASAHTIQVELQARCLVVLDVVGLPKQLDWCVITRRNQPLSVNQGLLRDFVLGQGAQYAACRLAADGPLAGAAA